jgi:hypothetical protein
VTHAWDQVVQYLLEQRVDKENFGGSCAATCPLLGKNLGKMVIEPKFRDSKG